jgi:hypothetical protein
MIEAYSFGKMTINGLEYTADLIIYPGGRIRDSWWRRDGHRLDLEDIEDLAGEKPEVIIAGTGAFGLVKPARTLRARLKEQGIDFIAYPTEEAVRRYREVSREKRVGACFHLTC